LIAPSARRLTRDCGGDRLIALRARMRLRDLTRPSVPIGSTRCAADADWGARRDSSRPRVAPICRIETFSPCSWV
jgi:hypothetical protein